MTSSLSPSSRDVEMTHRRVAYLDAPFAGVAYRMIEETTQHTDDHMIAIDVSVDYKKNVDGER